MPNYDDPLKALFPNQPAGYGPGNVPATATNPNGYGAFYYDNVEGGGPESLGRINVRRSEANPPADLPSWFPQAQAAKPEEEKEPPPPNYSEALTRAAGPGMFARFTKAPIKPSTPVSWKRFAEEGDELAGPAKQLSDASSTIRKGGFLTGAIDQMTNERNARVAPLKKVTFNDLRAQQEGMFGQGPIAGSGARGVANSVASMFGAPSGGAPSSPPSSSSVAAMFAAPPGGAPPPSSGGGGLFDPATISAMAPPPPRPKMTDAEVRALGMQASQMRADQSAMFGGPSLTGRGATSGGVTESQGTANTFDPSMGAPPPRNPQVEALKRSQQAMYSTPILGRR